MITFYALNKSARSFVTTSGLFGYVNKNIYEYRFILAVGFCHPGRRIKVKPVWTIKNQGIEVKMRGSYPGFGGLGAEGGVFLHHLPFEGENSEGLTVH